MTTSTWGRIPWSTLSFLVILFGLYANSNAQGTSATLPTSVPNPMCAVPAPPDVVSCGAHSESECLAVGCCHDYKLGWFRCYKFAPTTTTSASPIPAPGSLTRGAKPTGNAQDAGGALLVDMDQHCLDIADADRVACGPAWTNFWHCKARGCCFDRKGSLTRCYHGKTPGQRSAGVRSVVPVVLPCGYTVAPPVGPPCGVTGCSATVAPPVVTPCGTPACGTPACGATVAPPVRPCCAKPAPPVVSPCAAVSGCLPGSSWGSGEEGQQSETNTSAEGDKKSGKKDSKKDGKKGSKGKKNGDGDGGS